MAHKSPEHVLQESNWTPALVASGLPTDRLAVGDDSCDRSEVLFVCRRWRYRVRASDLAVIPTLLQFS